MFLSLITNYHKLTYWRFLASGSRSFLTDTILTMVLSGFGSTCDGSMLTWASLSISPTGVYERGVDDCAAAAPGVCLLRGLLKEGMLCPLKSTRCVTLMGIATKGCIRKELVKGEEDVDP